MIVRTQTLLQRANANAPVVIAFALFIALAIPASILNVAWRYIYVDLGQPYEALGMLLLFFTVGRLGSTFIAGRLTSRFGVWRCVFAGMSISLVGLTGMLISPAWLVLLLAILTLAFGWGIMDIGITLFIASQYRAGTINFLHASYGVGLTIGPLIVSLVVVTLGQNWRWSYLGPVVILAGLLTWTWFSRTQWVLPERMRTPENSGSRAGASIRATLSLPIMGAWLLVAFLYGGIETGTGQLSGDLLINARGLGEADANQWVSLYWGAFTLGRFVTGFIAGRFSEKAMLFGYTVFASIGALMLSLPGLSLALPGMLLIGLALAGVFPTLISSIPRRFGPDHAPNAIGFTIGVASAGVAILPGLGAFLAARADFAVIGPYLVGIALLLVASYVLLVRQWQVQADRVASE